MQPTSMIWITTSFEGFHKYPMAPEGVEFLKNEHRHIFHVKVWIDVFHDDRDIEFILFKRYVDSLIKGGQMDYKSCEMMCDDLHKEIHAKYPNRDIWISVSEDNENGAVKQYFHNTNKHVQTFLDVNAETKKYVDSLTQV